MMMMMMMMMMITTTIIVIIIPITNRQLFVDDTSILVIDSNKFDFNISINTTFLGINTWFKVSLLSLNFNKTQYLEFRTKHYYIVNHNWLYSLGWALASSLK